MLPVGLKFPARTTLRVLAPAAVLATIGVAAGALIDTTLNDFFQPGTQPNTLTVQLFTSNSCKFCHGFYDVDQEPYSRWAASMMAQSARDPIFHACLAIANQDMAGSGDLCIRCHAPIGWLEGRSTPTSGAGLIDKDFDGVSCHVCHRLVDPVYDPSENPPEDEAILNALSQIPTNPHTGQYVADPHDRRRGPYELDAGFFYHEWRQSPFHRESLLCAICHDVSNPAFTRRPDGTYALGPLNEPHPTHNKFDEFPIERTYSEWTMSQFAQGPVEMGGRFGGNITAVSSCQDCHMPKTSGVGCAPGLGGTFRDDLAQHDFNGANTWVLHAIRSLYDDEDTGLTDPSVAAALARTTAMLQAASDMELSQVVTGLRVRLINQTGHKLPSGYPEGRRMWINVRFFDSQNQLLREHGAYDMDTATLTTGDTKVYEAKLGMDADMAARTGLPAGESFHFVLNNVYLKDNRIPPRGFTNANFQMIQAAPVGHTYADGQYWDDTDYMIPRHAVRAEVAFFNQSTSREYIEFLRDANTTNNAGNIAYAQWVLHGKSAPVMMDSATIELRNPGDADGDNDCDLSDLGIVLASFGGGADGDLDGDGDTDLSDLGIVLSYFGT